MILFHILECQLELEQSVHKALLELHKCADSHGDAQLTDFIEGEYLKEQVEAEKEVGDMVTKIKRVGSDGLGIHIIDKELQWVSNVPRLSQYIFWELKNSFILFQFKTESNKNV